MTNFETMRRRLTMLLLAVLTSVAAGTASANDLPDPRITPGATNPDVTQENIQATVCVKGWTKTIRPPKYYTNKLKKTQIMQYRLQDRDPRDYEEDHLVALSIGGHPTDPRNLWPQPRQSGWNAQQKDQLEFVLYKMVCHREIGLVDAQVAMSSNWVEAYKRFVPTHPHYMPRGQFAD